MMDSHFVLIIVFLFLNDFCVTGYTLEDNHARPRSNFTPTAVTQSSIESYSAASDEIVTSYGLSSDAIIFPDQLKTYFPNRTETSTLAILSLEIYDPPKRSELKCDEYAEEIKNIIAATSTITTTMATTTQLDMLSNKNDLQSNNDSLKKVALGEKVMVEDNEFPHMVAIGHASDGKFALMCGAILISHIWALTAAHCTYGPNGSPSEARLGMNKLTDQRSGITIRIQMMIRHPDYAPPATYADIALIKLANSVIFGTSIRPACLYRSNETANIFYAYVTGWGATEYAGDSSDILQKALLGIIDNPSCAAQYGTSREIPRGITESMICASNNAKFRKDSCQGDSGGPLQIWVSRYGLYVVLGVVSFGAGCNYELPEVHTRVSHYLSWIEDIVWPQAH